MMELTEDFLKLLQIAVVVVGVLGLYFSYVSYNVTVSTREAQRGALMLGNSLLSSDCLTYYDIKSLFSEEKLNDSQNDPSCLKREYPYGLVEVDLQDSSVSPNKWQFAIGSDNMGGESTTIVAVKMNSGEIKPAYMVVKV